MKHIPVLIKEVLEALKPKKGQTIVDCTIGLGGHSAELLERGVRVIGLDLDPQNLREAQDRFEILGGNFSLHHGNFAGLPNVLGGLGIDRVDGILADLGVSSPHIDDPRRGFSYRRPGPLDMRMDPTRGKTASEVLDRMTEEELAQSIFELGDEEDAGKIAALIVARRPIGTTQQLMELVCQARDFTVQRAAGAKLHPAARTFQAIRMLVNRELPNLERLLAILPQCLKPGATAAILSFHSGEDRIVKQAFREGRRLGVYASISEDAILATEDEKLANSRSRSAKLRWARTPKKKSSGGKG
ncbi:MAG TPA: 16S rRNA (cytosine(1402)-N(4))-methyltransferase RsmH [Planctomycetota bacterium]|jgi:16S rRNA (cytosine1402-N4)-methyltransferase|nr:16S rRNA (cytosine(1402)-N(4))-methyltransferase RsmH [Planctomycetota bacterium]